MPDAELAVPADAATHARLDQFELRLAGLSRSVNDSRNALTIVAFSGDLDKLAAAFMLATGAAAMGMRVVIFFTFWALPALKQQTRFRGKAPLDKLLTAMQPSGPSNLGVSRWNLFGLGALLLRRLMRKRKIEPLANLIDLARQEGVRMVACTTSMELMAITREELVKGVEMGGVATCLDAASLSGVTLFI